MIAPESRQILVVEDQSSSRNALVELLRDEGHEVGAAEDGRRAMEHLDQKPWEVLILDFHLGDMTGADLLRYVRKKGHDSHAIMVSGSVDVVPDGEGLAVRGNWSECRALGAHAELTKPVKFGELLEVIDELPSRCL